MTTPAVERAGRAARPQGAPAGDQARPDGSREWHLLTGEYPPRLGGVADFTRLVARELAAAGERVHVWHPPTPGAPADPGVALHEVGSRFGPAELRALGQALDAARGRARLLVQWVPHAFGARSMNVRLAAWIAWRGWAHRDVVEVIAHEPGLAWWEGTLRQRLVAWVHRLMAFLLVHSARRVWISIPTWEQRLRPLALGRRREFRWLPIPNVIPVVATAADAAALRARRGLSGVPLVVHFGTYGSHHLPQLEEVFGAILAGAPAARLVLAGPGGERLRERLARRDAEAAARVVVTGPLDASELSAMLAAADVVVQPYPDGLSSRRTSAMAPLAHGCAIVSTDGPLTEPLWRTTPAVVLAPADAPGEVARAALALLSDPDARRRLADAARDLYATRFDVRHAIAALLTEPVP